MSKYVVYLISYSGDDLPPYYIGSTSQKNIDNGYLGSVRSKAYKELWKYHSRNNRDRFKVSILTRTDNRKRATEIELLWQKKLSVVSSDLFANMAYAAPNGFFGRDVTGERNPRFGAANTSSTRKKISEANKDHILVRELGSGNFARVHKDDFDTAKHVTVTPSSAGSKQGAEAVSRAMKTLAEEGKHWFQSEEFKAKTSERRKGVPLTETQRKLQSASRTELYNRPWLLKEYKDVDFNVFCKILDFFLKNYKHRSRVFVRELVQFAKDLGFTDERINWFRKAMTYEESRLRFINWGERYRNENQNN